MSSALAFGAVTAVLRSLLLESLATQTLPASAFPLVVSALPPDTIVTSANEAASLNLFLYQVTPNLGWRNAALPSRDAAGERITNPPLALDLHYLLSGYGKEGLFEVMLGCGMQLMHEVAVLSRQEIRDALVGGPYATSDLAEQAEQIRIAPMPMSTEEMSKLWAALQAHYRPTAAYVVSVVLIESQRRTRPTLPVRQRNLLVQQFARPVIEQVEPQIARPGESIVLKGYNLKGTITTVRLGTLDMVPTLIESNRLSVLLPAALGAGVNTAQVVHPVDFGTPSEPHRGLESNVIAFMLRPLLDVAPGLSVARGATLSFSVTPPVGAGQRVALLLDGTSLALPARAPASPPLSSLSVAIPTHFEPGSYFARLMVDGAQSDLVLESDAVQPDPLKKRYAGPKVVVT